MIEGTGSIPRFTHCRRLQLLDLHSGDPVPFHFFNGEAVALVFKRFADAGNFLQPSQHEASQSFEIAITRQG